MILKGFFWEFLGKGANQVVSFFISIILARILGPEEFGLVGMSMVIISIAQVFGDLGFSSGVIQAKNTNPVQYSTIFFINLTIGIALTIITFSSAGFVADFYQKEEVTPVFRYLAFLFVLSSISTLPIALLKKKVDFKKFFEKEKKN